MAKYLNNFSLIFIAIFVFLHAKTNAEQNLTWLIETEEVAKNLNSNAKTSIASDTTRMLLKELDNTQFHFQVAQLPRIEKLLNSKGNYCASERIKTDERVKNNLYSLPVHIYPSLKLYYLAKLHPLPSHLINKDKSLTSLNDLFKSKPRQALTIVKKRSYGAFLDKQIRSLSPKNLIERAGSNQYQAIPKMLLKGRIDFALLFPTAYLKELNRESNRNKSYSISISGDMPHITGYVACSRTPLGQRVITQINSILLSLYKQEAFYQAHIRYVSEMDAPLLTKQFNALFIER